VSLLWCANEKECNDSDGNRVKSSPNGIAGEPGPAAREREAFREFAAEEEADRNSKAGRFDSEGSRAVLMRRKPVSRSAVRMGDLFVADMQVSYCLMQARCRQSCEVPTLALFAAHSGSWKPPRACSPMHALTIYTHLVKS
jgi:hypothetical protein